MSAITLYNKIPTQNGLCTMAEFRVMQGCHLIARLGVPSGGSATVPTTVNYVCQATTTTGGHTLTSNTVSFTQSSARLTAQMKMECGYYDFQLVSDPCGGLKPYTITCENTFNSPVQFQFTNRPIAIATVVDENNDAEISTAQEWKVFAIAGGITTATIVVTDPNAGVNIVQNNGNNGYSLMLA